MAANNNPVFVQTPISTSVQISVANPNRDGTGVMYDFVSAGANGTRIDVIALKAAGNTTDGMIRLYEANSDNTGTVLIYEVPVYANTASGTIPTWAEYIGFDTPGLVVAAGKKIRASTQNSETFNLTVVSGGNL